MVDVTGEEEASGACGQAGGAGGGEEVGGQVDYDRIFRHRPFRHPISPDRGISLVEDEAERAAAEFDQIFGLSLLSFAGYLKTRIV